MEPSRTDRDDNDTLKSPGNRDQPDPTTPANSAEPPNPKPDVISARSEPTEHAFEPPTVMPYAHTDKRYSKKSQAFRVFDHIASAVTRWVGSPLVFMLALLSVIVWAVTGPIFHFSDTWQLVINTGTTVVTFLMVFLIQQSQNKDSLAIHLKLNELLASHRSASNKIVGAEDLDEQDLRELARKYEAMANANQPSAGPSSRADSREST
jgi:low affinity Fe/Cu permease